MSGSVSAAGPALFDAHCHLQLPRLLAHAADVVASAQLAGVQKAAVCGCTHSDWAAVGGLASEHPDFVVPQFGVHPWWAGEHEGPAAIDGAAGWVDGLRALLQRHPEAGVGECGLDGAQKKSIPMDVQLAVLRPQLALARELQRPVSLHCVGSHGVLLETLAQAFGKKGHGPGLVLHAYSGSAEMVAPFSKLNCYFSFSASILHIQKHAAALRAVPRDRLLIETDSPDQLPRDLHGEGAEVPPAWGTPLSTPRRDDEGPLNEPALLRGVCAGAAAALGTNVEEVSAWTAGNARRVFLGLASAQAA